MVVEVSFILSYMYLFRNLTEWRLCRRILVICFALITYMYEIFFSTIIHVLSSERMGFEQLSKLDFYWITLETIYT